MAASPSRIGENMQRMSCGLKELKLAPPVGGVDVMEFSGYGAVFGNIDAYGDVIDPGAFAHFLADVKSGAQPWPAMLSQHGGYGMSADDMTPIGIWTEMSADGTGLKMTGKLADTPRGREMHALMKMTPRPALDGLSIGYIAKESVPRSKPEEPRRTLKRVDVVEVSPVTFPANRKARVQSVKGIEDFLSITEIEEYLRDVGGFSIRESKTIISAIKSQGSRDASGDTGPRDAAELKAVMDALNRNIASR